MKCLKVVQTVATCCITCYTSILLERFELLQQKPDFFFYVFITKLILHYKILCILWLEYVEAEMFLDEWSTP